MKMHWILNFILVRAIKTVAIASFIIVVILFSGTLANAEGGTGTLALMYGLSVPDSDNSTPHRVFGAKGLAYLAPAFSVGGYYIATGKSEGTGGRKFDYTLHGIEAAYHIAAGEGDTFISFRAGSSKVHTIDNTTKLIFSPYHYGLSAGHSYNLTSWLAIGFEGSYFYIEKGSTTEGVTHYKEDSFGVTQFLAVLALQL